MLFDISTQVHNCSPSHYANLMTRIVRVESDGNPFAIGVVKARLARQPVNLSEATATAKALIDSKYNFSIGLAQINQIHFSGLGWSNQLAEGFNACNNIAAGALILDKCFTKARQYHSQRGVDFDPSTISKMAVSCYYSGDLFLGGKLGYVNKVMGFSSKSKISNSFNSTTMDYINEN